MDKGTYFGGDIKPYIELEPVGNLNMDDYDFQAEYFCYSSRRVVVKKQDMRRESANKYIASISTKDLGTGTLKCLVTRKIPDSDFPNGMRIDVRLFVYETPIIGV